MVNLLTKQKFLAIYSGVSTLLLMASVLLGAKQHLRNAEIDTITVHRINVVEPEGTPRLILSSRESFPGG